MALKLLEDFLLESNIVDINVDIYVDIYVSNI